LDEKKNKAYVSASHFGVFEELVSGSRLFWRVALAKREYIFWCVVGGRESDVLCGMLRR
jgi:hypothetical protein